MAIEDIFMPTTVAGGSGIETNFLALGGLLVFIAIVAIAAYVYNALVWMTIARKLGYDKHWLAWIPIANSFLYPILAGKSWAWGFIYVGGAVLTLALFPTMIFPPIFLIILIVLLLYGTFTTVMTLIWHWKIFEKRNYPGALSLIQIAAAIPYLNFIGGPAWLVVIGIVAWSDR